MKWSTNIGYSPISARERKIKDGSKYDKYFPKPDLKKTLLKRDGEVEDTVKKMQQIVVDYSHQVRGLCKDVLKGKTVRESVKNVFDFVYNYIKYQVEDGEKLRTPAYTWYEAQVLKRQNPDDDTLGADCDCMSIFCGCCFREMRIPFSFRVTGYENKLGFCNGFQHVYTIAYDTNGKEIICDPVYIEFDKEKQYAIQNTYPMSLNGTDIIMLSGLGDDTNTHEYVEQSDGGLGELAGRKKRKEKKAKRKEKKKARKAARKEKRAAKKAIRKAKKSGDKEALKAAKAAKKAAKKKIKANRTGIAKAAQKVGKGIAKAGKAIARFTVATSMTVPRKMFCLLLRLNFRGLAKKLSSNEKAREKFGKVWRKLGGSTKSWTKAVEKGKSRKPLFGSKKLKGYTELQLQQLGAVIDEWNYANLGGATLGDLYTERQLGDLGFATTSVAAAIASAAPIVKKVIDVMKQVGENIPETAEEAEEMGEEYDTMDEDSEVDTSEVENEEPESEEDFAIDSQISTSDDPDTDIDDIIDIETEDVDEQEEDELSDDDDTDGLEGLVSKISRAARHPRRTKQSTSDPDYLEYVYIDEVEGLGELGAGLFKKLASGIKSAVSKAKTKKAAKKAAKTAQKEQKKQAKTAKKAAKTAKKEQKKQAKTAKKAAKTAKKEQKKQAKADKKAAKAAQKATYAEPDDTDTSYATEATGGKLRNFITTAADSEAGQAAREIAMQQAQNLANKYLPQPSPAPDEDDGEEDAPNAGNDAQKTSWLSRNKTAAIVGGILMAGLIGGGIYLATRKKPQPQPGNAAPTKLAALPLY